MKMCPKCGCIMKDTDEKCPNCGNNDQKQEVNTSSGLENPFENINLHKRTKKKESNILNIPEEADPFEKKQTSTSPNFTPDLPKVKTPIKNTSTNSSTVNESRNPKGKFGLGETNQITQNNSPSNNKLLTPLCMIVIIIIGVVVLITNNNSKQETKNPSTVPDIKLSENENPKDKPNDDDKNNKIEDEKNPPSEKDPNENVNPPDEIPENTFVAKLGKYTFYVPNDYVAVPYEEDGLTLSNGNLGITMTFIEGVYDLKTYRSMQDDLTSSMQQDGTIVNRAYSTLISNHDLQIMEVIEPSVSYIMAITQINSSGQTLIIMAADMYDPQKFNYEILNEALKIIDTIK